MNKIWEYMGREYPFDITSAEMRNEVSLGFAELEQVADNGDGVCEAICGFFDRLFGKGVGITVCGEADSAEAHIAAYISFIGFMCAQIDQFSQMREELKVQA